MRMETALRKGHVRVGDYLLIPRTERHRVGDTFDLPHGYRGTVVIAAGHECYKITYSPFQSRDARFALARRLAIVTGRVFRPRWYVRWFRTVMRARSRRRHQ